MNFPHPADEAADPACAADALERKRKRSTGGVESTFVALYLPRGNLASPRCALSLCESLQMHLQMGRRTIWAPLLAALRAVLWLRGASWSWQMPVTRGASLAVADARCR